MESQILRFIYLLRALGIRISTAETIDSLKALAAIDMLSKNQFKTALMSTLIKSPGDLLMFNRAFDAYFASLLQRQENYNKFTEEKQHVAQEIAKSESALQFKNESLELTDEEKLLFSQLSPEDKQKILDFLEKSNKGNKVELNFKPIIENLVRGSLEFWKRNLNNPGASLPFDDLEDDELNAFLQHLKNEKQKNKLQIEDQDMQHIDKEDYYKIQVSIKKMTKKLAARLTRRCKQSKKISRVDIRKSVRKNIQYGGILLKLSYKTKRKQRPKLLLLCDVSGSMARYATFVIQFIFGLSTALDKIESYIFAEQLEKVTNYFYNAEDFSKTMADLMNNSNAWGKGTNLGQSLESLLKIERNNVTANSIMIILSDGKTVDADLATHNLKIINRQVRDVLWLNTLPKEQWPKHRAIEQLRQYCHMYQCNTVNQLNQIISHGLTIS